MMNLYEPCLCDAGKETIVDTSNVLNRSPERRDSSAVNTTEGERI